MEPNSVQLTPQDIRLKRFFMSLFSYGIWVFLGGIGTWLDLLKFSWTVYGLIVLGIALSQGVFFALIKTGLNQRFREPALTMPQIMVALIWVLILMLGTEEARGLMMMVYLVTLYFGLFALSKRAYLLLSLFAFLGYALLVWFELTVLDKNMNWPLQWMSLLVLASVLLWISFIGSHVAMLRLKLLRRNQELTDAYRDIEVLATHDELTQLYNRRRIMKVMETALKNQIESGMPTSLLILDIDHFKVVNDRFGHLLGDSVLKRVAQAMRQALRKPDLMGPARETPAIGRFGGEEFMVLMPDTTLQGAVRCAERIRQVVEAIDLGESCDNLRITVSIGVTTFANGESLEHALNRADKALYLAKTKGRNRIEVRPAPVGGDPTRVPNLRTDLAQPEP